MSASRRTRWGSSGACASNRPRIATSTQNASRCMAPSSSPPTMRSSPSRSTASLPAGTRLPSTCSAIRPPRPSASRSTSWCRRTEARGILNRISSNESIAQHETVRICKNGRQLDVVLNISPLRSDSGQIIGASKIAHDITEEKQSREKLRRETEERQRIFETSQDLILVTDGFGNFIQVSPSVKDILGFSPDDMIGHSATDFIHPDDLENTRNEMRAARRGQTTRSFEARYYHFDGHEVSLNWMGTWSEPVKRHFFIGRDLTEKQAAEAQFRQVQKMDSIGQLTGGVAHDFNNVLTVITGTIGILADAVADRPELAAITKLIDDAAERGAQLTKHLLAFARKQPLQPREIDVNALTLEAAKLLHPTLG